jgi:dipeptide/tripeptide permease
MDNNSLELESDENKTVLSGQNITNYTNLTQDVEPSKRDGICTTKSGFPVHIFLIILNEFCERFSYYGLRTVLIIYFTKFILIEKDSATAYYHGFTVICYLSPVLGAIISDGYLGKFKTIVSISILYLIGEIILFLTSFKPLGAPNLVGPLIGLLIIGIGTGGIKPCVSAFGGDQFIGDQKKHLGSFFSVFYMSINIGSLIASLITPLLRSSVSCYGGDCYPLSFGVPTALMFVAIIVFVVGKPLYYCKPVDRSQNVIVKLTKCIFCALKTKITSSSPKKSHWLDYADHKYDNQFISDAKSFAKVTFMFLPLPIFWALFDQQGSRWTLQATKMDTKLSSDSWIEADQIQSVNSILVIGLIPVFNWIVYPLFDKCNLFKKQLQRMAAGMILGGVAFAATALVENSIQTAFMNKNSAPRTIEFINLAPSNMFISSSEGFSQTIGSFNQFSYMNSNGVNQNFSVNYMSQSIQSTFQSSNDDYYKNNYLLFSSENTIQSKLFTSSIKEPPTGKTKLRIYFLNIDGDDARNYKFESKPEIPEISLNNLLDSNKNLNLNEKFFVQTNPKLFDFTFTNLNTNQTGNQLKKSFILDNGACHTFIFIKNQAELNLVKIVEINENQISFGYQIIQYFIITCGEIMFSISGLSFAYSQSPESMKSVLQAAWLLTNGFGNIIVIIIAEAHFFENELYEYVLFAGLIFVFTIIFLIMCYFYVYNESVSPIVQSNADEDKNEIENEKGNLNRSFVNDTEDNRKDSGVQILSMTALEQPN